MEWYDSEGAQRCSWNVYSLERSDRNLPSRRPPHFLPLPSAKMRPIPVLSAVLALAGLSSAASNSSSTTGSKTCNSHLCIETLLDSSSSTLTYTLTTPGSPSGWYGVGTGSKMAGSTMWVVWSSGGTLYWSERDGYGHNAPDVASSNTATYLSAQSMSNSTGLQASWTTPYSGSADSSYPLIWASSGSTPSGSSSASIKQHSNYGNFVMDLTQSLASNGTVTTSTNSGTQQYERLIKVHAILMAIAWGILAPFAVLLARFGRATTFKWVAAHQWIQIVGTTGLTLAGFGVAVAAVAANHESQFRGGHQKLGLAITILVFLQLVGGWWIHHKYNAQRTRRPITNWMHMVIGMAFLIAGFFAMYTGIDTWDEGKTWMKVLFWVWAAVSDDEPARIWDTS